MIRLLLPLTFILQGVCLWHAFKTDKEDRWFFMIVFLPFVGSAIYFYKFLLDGTDFDNLKENVKENIDPDYKTEKMEKDTEFTDTFANKLILGDRYVNERKFVAAIKIFESCLEGFNSESPEVYKRLLKAHYLNKDYLLAAKFGQKLEGVKNFEKTDEKIAYAWAMYYLGNHEGAESAFKTMDIFFSNYKHRYEYAVFLLEVGRKDEARAQLKELLEEFEQMDVGERKMKKIIYKEIAGLHSKIR